MRGEGWDKSMSTVGYHTSSECGLRVQTIFHSHQHLPLQQRKTKLQRISQPINQSLFVLILAKEKNYNFNENIKSNNLSTSCLE